MCGIIYIVVIKLLLYLGTVKSKKSIKIILVGASFTKITLEVKKKNKTNNLKVIIMTTILLALRLHLRALYCAFLKPHYNYLKLPF